MQEPQDETAIWLALIGAAASILGALRADKWPAYFFGWIKGLGTKKKEKDLEERTLALRGEIDGLKKELANERLKIYMTQYAFKTVLPYIKELMKDNPQHVTYLDQLEDSILSEGPPPTDRYRPDMTNREKRNNGSHDK